MGVLSKLAGKKSSSDEFLDMGDLDKKGSYGPASGDLGLDDKGFGDIGGLSPSAQPPSDFKKDIELLTSKIETLKAEIEGLKHRLANIESRLQLRAEQAQTERYGTSAGAVPSPTHEEGWHF